MRVNPRSPNSRSSIVFDKEAAPVAGERRRSAGPASDSMNRAGTGQKRAAAALINGENKYRAIFENALEGIFQSTPEGRLLDVNPSFAKIAGFDSPEAMVAQVTDIARQLYVNPEEREKLKQLLQAQGRVEGFEVQAYGKNKSKIWISLNVHAVYDANGRILHYQGMFNDITERKRAEEARRSSEEKFHKIFKTSPNGISITRLADGVYLDVNESFTQIMGYTREEIMGRSSLPGKLDIWVNREDRDRLVASLKAVGEVVGLEAPLQGKKGNIFYGRLSARILEINDEACILAILDDVTERRRIEEELLRSEEKFRTIFENNSAATALIEPDSTFSMVNDAYCRMSGFSKEEILGMSWTQIIPPEDLERMKEYNRRRYLNPQEAPARYEFTFYNKNGEIRDGLISPSVIPSSRQLISSVIDITEWKQAEKELKKSKERLRALAAHLQSIREEERANISREIHDDLGQLLTGVKMDLSWILRHPLPEPAALKKKVQAMSQLIDQTVQTVRRISTELRPRILDDFGLVAALEWQAEEFTKKTGIPCLFRATCRQLDLQPDLSIAVFRIFQEALTNVARHSGATQVEASLTDAQGLILTIRDNGMGISKEEKGRSKSLGLVGMRERALIFGGTLEIKGQKGKGTKVLLRLPL